MIATNAFKQAVVGTYSSSDTVIELDSISNVEGDADYLPNGGFKLILYDGLFGNPADANNAGKYEIWDCVSVNYATSEVTVLRGQENTDALTIGAGASWQVFYGATKALLESLDHTPTNGSPTTFASGSIGNRKIDLYYTYDYVNGVWVRKPKDLSQEPDYILESIDEGLSPNDLVSTYGVLKANQDGGVIYFASGSMEVSTVDGRALIDKWKPNTGDTVDFTGTDRPELTVQDGQWKVCVEKGVTNLIVDPDKSGDPSSAWSFTRVTGDPAVPLYKFDAWKIFHSGGAAGRTEQTFGTFSGDDETLVVVIESIDSESVFIELRRDGTTIGRALINPLTGLLSAQIGDVVTLTEITDASPNGGVVYVLRITVNTDSGGVRNIRINPDNSTSEKGVIVHFVQHIESAYPVLFTEGTRTAPSSEIPDALNATGVIYGRVDMVRDDSVVQLIFDSGGSNSSQRSFFGLNASNLFIARIFGNTGGELSQANPFTWGNNERKLFDYGIAYDADNLYLGLYDGVDTFVYSIEHDINSDALKDLTIGGAETGTANHSSVYVTHIGKSTDIPTTAQEFQEIFERMP